MKNEKFKNMIEDELSYVYMFEDYDYFNYTIDIVEEDYAEITFNLNGYKLELTVFYSEEDEELKFTTISESDERFNRENLLEQFILYTTDYIEYLKDVLERSKRI